MGNDTKVGLQKHKCVVSGNNGGSDIWLDPRKQIVRCGSTHIFGGFRSQRAY
jgi:hypothetical protein